MLLVTWWQHAVPGAASTLPVFFTPHLLSHCSCAVLQNLKFFLVHFFANKPELCHFIIEVSLQLFLGNIATQERKHKPLESSWAMTYTSMNSKDHGHSLSEVISGILPTVIPKQQRFLFLVLLLFLILDVSSWQQWSRELVATHVT